MPTQATGRAYPVRFPGIPLMGATAGSVDSAAARASAARSAATRAAPVGYGREGWYCHRRGPRKTRYQSWHQGPRAWRPRSACWICWCPRFPWTPGRGCRRARGCGFARGVRGLGGWRLVREGVDPRRTDGVRLRGHGLVESCERVGLQEFVKVGQRCQVRQRSEAGQRCQIWQGIELGQDEGVGPARGLLAACARRTRLRLAGRRHARIVVTHETFLPCGTGRWDARESIPSRCRRQEEAGTKALTPALDTAMSMSS